MHDDSSSVLKGTLLHASVRPTRLCQPSRLHVAQWARWTLMAVMAPARRKCDQYKSSRTKRHPRRSRLPALWRQPRRKRRRRAPMVVETRKVRTMNRLCAPRGACAAVMTVGMTVMKGRRTEKTPIWKRITMAREICAWRVRLRIRGSAANVFSASRFLSHLASVDHMSSPFLSCSVSHVHLHAGLISTVNKRSPYPRPVLPRQLFFPSFFLSFFSFYLFNFLPLPLP